MDLIKKENNLKEKMAKITTHENIFCHCLQNLEAIKFP